jgi:23S rRNA pseudouridine2605 synthase
MRNSEGKKPGSRFGGKKPFSSSKFEKKGKEGSFKSDKGSFNKKDRSEEGSEKPRFKKDFKRKDGDKPFRKDKKAGEKFKKEGDFSSRKDRDGKSRKSFKKPFDKDKKPDREGGYEKKDGYKKTYGDKDKKRGPFKRDDDGGSEKSYKRPYEKKEGGFKKRNDYKKDDRKDSYGDKRDGGFKKRGDYKKDDREGSYGDKKSYDKKEGGFKKREQGGDDRKDFNREKKYGKRDGSFEKRSRSFDSGEKRSSYSEKGSFDKELKYTKDHKEEKRKTKTSFETTGLIRLNKYLSNAGICSRREADELIKAGAVSVNGKVITEMGFKVGPDDKINYGGETLRNEKKVYILLNKPKDYITTTDDPRERRTVMELIAGACKERVYPVGRLDRNTTGLLLFTNDGELADRLMHPKHGIRKIYHVTIGRNIKVEDYAKLNEGFELEDGFIKPDEVSFVGEGRKEIGIEIHSGKNRIVRRIFEHLGYEVIKLDRVSFAGLTKKDLPRAKWRFLSPKEVSFLKMVG